LDIHVRESESALQFGEGNDVLIFADEEELNDFFLFLEMCHDVLLGHVFGVVLADDRGVGFVHGMD